MGHCPGPTMEYTVEYKGSPLPLGRTELQQIVSGPVNVGGGIHNVELWEYFLLRTNLTGEICP